MTIRLGWATALLLACGTPSTRAPTNAPAAVMPTVTPFDYVGQSWVRVPARLGDGPESKMMIDTGMGVTLLTPSACARVRCVPDGSWTGKRMSGQEIRLSLARVASLTVAGHTVHDARVAVFDSETMMPPELGVEGIAGLDLFGDRAITFDHHAMQVIIETPRSLADRKGAGSTVPVRVKREGPSVEVYLPLQLAPGVRAEMEVDSGSLNLILDDRFMPTLGVDPDGAATKRKEGSDETGATYVRHFATTPHALPVVGAPSVGVDAGRTVMFQKIIHDGLLGQEFLREHTVTFDLPGATMTFGR